VAAVHVELVSVERLLWSGEARMVIARTTEGELGVLPGHAPLLGELAPGGIVRIQQEDGGEELVFAVHGGFLSVTEDGVSILAELAERADEIDVGRAQQALEQARSAGEDDDEASAAASRALSRLRASGQPV
jgi:F-type H+-transporting ATPase subunit epsilon